MSDYGLKSPRGMKSHLPEVAWQLNELSARINRVFRCWGYQPIITPTLEYYDSLILGMGKRLKRDIYKLIDYRGDILALRPEMTAPIARTMAGRLDQLSFPQRLCYQASVFRYEQPQTGKDREVFQIGVELIGEKSELADAEAIILAIEALLTTGIRDFTIDIGHVGYLEGLMNKVRLGEREKTAIKTYLSRRDLVGLGNYVDKLGLSEQEQDLLLALPRLRGGQAILEQAGALSADSQSERVIERLNRLYYYLADYGLARYIAFDLSLLRDFEYYTGVVFEGFTAKLGYTICGGGRYDHLIRQFGGRDLPAIGFAIGLERVRLALQKQDFRFTRPGIDGLIVFSRNNSRVALKVLRELHRQGKVVLIEEQERLDPAFLHQVAKRGVCKIISFGNGLPDEIELFQVKAGVIEKEVIRLEDGWEERVWPH